MAAATSTSDAPGRSDGRGRGTFRPAARLLRALLKHHKRLFFTAVGGAAVFATFTVLSSVIIGQITDKVITPRFEHGKVAPGTVGLVLGLLVAAAVVRAMGVVVRRTWASRTTWRITEMYTAQVVDRVVAQPASWHRRQSTGDLITRAGVDAEAATSVLGPLPYASSVVVLLLLSGTWLVIVDPVLGAGAVAMFPVLLALNVGYQRRVDRYFDAAQDELGKLSAAVHESFEGVHVVKAFGAERRETERLSVIAARLRQARIETVRLRSVFEALLDGVPTTANVLLLIAGAYRVRSGALTVGELLSFVYLFTLLVLPLRLIGFALSELPHSYAGYGRLQDLFGQPIEHDPADDLARGSSNDVVLDAVVATHDGERDVLDGVSAVVPGGKTVAVVGATGAGKTTLLHLVAGLIPARSGTITVPAGKSCLVFQEPFLVAGTVRENVTLGESHSDDAVLRALDAAEASFVAELPEGLDTVVGERGVGLSGGQRQRIALARALVRHPAVLLLDDTTSALDPGTEARVIANLGRVLGETTVIAVASRPSTIALADEVLYLADGKVVAHGTHDELIASNDHYRELMQAFEHDRAELEAQPVGVPAALPADDADDDWGVS